MAKMDAIEIADGDGVGAGSAILRSERAVGHQHG
jgi:hypothetical protein